jgi:hypothetical protein
LTTPLREKTSRPVLLLVHGARLGAWSWEKVQPELTARGWEVETVELPSVADRGAPRFGLHDDAKILFTDVPQEDSDRAIARMKPFGYVAVTEAPTAAAWHSLPSTYILCERDTRADVSRDVMS